MPEEDAVRMLANANIPVWSFWNSGDDPAVVEFNRRMHARLVDAGLHARSTEYDAAGHDCWTDAYRTPALYDWLWRQQRSSNASRGMYRAILDDWPLPQWTLCETGRVEPDGDVLKLRADGVGPVEAVFPAPLGDAELAFEFQTEQTAFTVLLRAVDSTSPDVRCVIEAPERGTGGMLADGEWLGFGDPVAQRSLKAAGWNDVRVQVAGERITLELNGSRLCSAAAPGLRGASRRMGIASSGAATVRFLRWRRAEGVEAR
jgi:hypothetical protein